MRKKILVIFGTRPEAIKLAPVIRQLKIDDTFETLVFSTGQHREMLKQVLDIFKLEIDFDLDLMKPNQNLFDITSDSLVKLGDWIKDHEPDLVLVQGDTTTAFTAALASFYRKIKVGHVEAGLRSFNIHSPYPEEVNRRFISILSDYNFAPTEDTKANLLREGCNPSAIYLTGNTVIDALYQMKNEMNDEEKNHELEKHIRSLVGDDFFDKEFILITMHRREKFGQQFKDVLDTFKFLAEKYPQYNFIYPVHLNPNVKKPVEENLSGIENFYLVPPQEYPNFIYLMSRCKFILSDSGGVQEECYVFEKPIIVMRDNTERQEAVNAGYAFLTGSDGEKIKSEFAAIVTKLNEGFDFFKSENPFGDGKASQRIVDIIKKSLS